MVTPVESFSMHVVYNRLWSYTEGARGAGPGVGQRDGGSDQQQQVVEAVQLIEQVPLLWSLKVHLILYSTL